MARGDYPSAKQDQFMVRFPDGLRDRIRMAAETNNRSMNAEIVATLEEAYPAPNPVEEAMQELGAILRRYKAGTGDPAEFEALPGFIKRIVLEEKKREEEEGE